jgi:hypothetical protein
MKHKRQKTWPVQGKPPDIGPANEEVGNKVQAEAETTTTGTAGTIAEITTTTTTTTPRIKFRNNNNNDGGAANRVTATHEEGPLPTHMATGNPTDREVLTISAFIVVQTI